MKFYTTEKIGNTLEKTPEGFLLARDVAIARTGEMLYGPGEVFTEDSNGMRIPFPVGRDGIIHIHRDASEVFSADTIASAQGKPIVDEHPEYENVDPSNWRELAVGSVNNVRRGDGANSDLMIADFLITDAAAIQAVLDGKKEVSCGYDAKYEVLSPGYGKQHKIIINHVALVDSGRCGSRCAIGDRQTVVQKRRRTMKWFDKLKKAVDSGDQSATAAVIEEISEAAVKSPDTHVHIHTRDEESEEEKKKREEKEKETKDRSKFSDAALDARFGDMDKKMETMSKDIKSIKDAFEKKDDEDKEDKDKKETKDEEIEFEAEAPAGTGDSAWKSTKDSAFMAESFQETLSLAEIIMPGIQLPTFDSKAPRGKTLDSLCQFRRKVLTKAADLDRETSLFLDGVTRGRTLDKLTCGEVRTAFNAVGELKRNGNNKSSTRDGVDLTVVGGGQGIKGAIKTPADLNKKLHEMYK